MRNEKRPRTALYPTATSPSHFSHLFTHSYNAAMSALTFRTATTADIPALIELVTSAYRGDASRAGWTTEADLLDGARIDAERLAADIERPRSVILLGEAGDVLALDSSGLVAATGGRTVAVVGIPDVVVIDTGDAVLVTTTQAAQDVKRVVDALKAAERTALT